MNKSITITSEMAQEYIARLEREGKSKDYVDGSLDGMSFVLEFLQSMMKLSEIRKELIRKEHGSS